MEQLARIKRYVAAGRARARAKVEDWRVRRHWFDHLLRTARRYQTQHGDQLAGSVTYFAFLSFFPIIALAFAVVGYVVTIRPDALETLTQAINSQLPGLAERIGIDQIAGAKTGAGIIGLLGLLYAGLGAVNALRDALRLIWMTTEPRLGFVLGKLRDLVALLLIGLTLLLSVVVGGFATQATGVVLEWLGLRGTPLQQLGLGAAGIAVSLAADLLVFTVILGWLARPPQPRSVVLRGALLGAIAFGLLKQLATLVLSGTLSNPVYGVWAVVAGLLIWINLSARITLLAAAWTATAGYGPPPAPTPVPESAVTPS